MKTQKGLQNFDNAGSVLPKLLLVELCKQCRVACTLLFGKMRCGVFQERAQAICKRSLADAKRGLQHLYDVQAESVTIRHKKKNQEANKPLYTYIKKKTTCLLR